MNAFDKLTPRQRDILIARAVGKTNFAIARELGISPQTVKNVVTAMFRRLDARNMEHAIWMTFAPAPDETIISCAEYDALKNVARAARRDTDKTMSVQVALAALDAITKEST